MIPELDPIANAQPAFKCNLRIAMVTPSPIRIEMSSFNLQKCYLARIFKEVLSS